MGLMIRTAVEEDLPALREIYADAVLTAEPAAYTAAQVRAWAAFAQEPAFATFVFGVNTYVAEDADGRVGFCGIGDDGHVASVYVRGQRLGQGIGTAMLRFAMRTHPRPGSGRYYAEASAFSLPLFERCGFRLLGTERVERGGAVFERYLLEKASPTGR